MIHSAEFYWTWIDGSPTSNRQTSKTHPGARSGATYWKQPDNQVERYTVVHLRLNLITIIILNLLVIFPKLNAWLAVNRLFSFFFKLVEIINETNQINAAEKFLPA